MISTLLELVGLALMVIGCALLEPWLAFMAAGAGLMTIGFALSPHKHPEAQ